MSKFKSFAKSFGDWELSISEPWPRWVELCRREGSSTSPYRMELETARDLHHALGRLIALADADDDAAKNSK